MEKTIWKQVLDMENYCEAARLKTFKEPLYIYIEEVGDEYLVSGLYESHRCETLEKARKYAETHYAI